MEVEQRLKLTEQTLEAVKAYMADPNTQLECSLAGIIWNSVDNAKPKWSIDHYRVKPGPQRLPLGPEDVPPGSVVRATGQIRLWAAVEAVGYDAIRVQGNHIKFTTLMSGYEIKRPGANWAPCSKEAK